MLPVQYHSNGFPPKSIDLAYLSSITGKASVSLGRYDGLLSAIPNSYILLSPLTTQEAVQSSSIEGTRVTMSEVLEIAAGATSDKISQAQRDDTEEVMNYRRTLHRCAALIKERPISQHMIRAAHAILMRGVRGKDKSPGRYRIHQNWIGPPGCEQTQAGFIPIAPEHLQSGMDAWSSYIETENTINPLIKLAVLHVEFEALHPFLDGNGRLGRMLIPLFLCQEKILSSPSFYMSAYLEKNREEYQERMRAVSRDGAWTEWVEFFVKGIGIQAEENIDKARKILDLYNEMKDVFRAATHSQYAQMAQDFLFEWLFFSTKSFCDFSKIPEATARHILRQLVKADVIRVSRQGKGRQPTFYWFEALRKVVDPKYAVNL